MVKVAKAIAANTDLSTAQAFIFNRENFYLSILISAQGDDIFTKVRQEASDLENSFFTSEKSLPARLEDLMSLINDSFKDADNLQVLLASWKENILYILSVGNFKAYMLRETQTSSLVSEEQSGQLISGYIHPGDKLFLVNQAVSDGLTPERLTNLSVDGFEEEVESLAIQNPQTQALAGIMVDYQEEEAQREIIPSLNQDIGGPSKVSEAFRKGKQLLLEHLPKTKKARVYLAVAILLIFSLGGFFYVRKQSSAQKDAQFNSFYSRARDEFNQAKALKDSDTDSAKESLNKSKQDLASSLKIKPDSSEALKLKKEIEGSTADILRIATIPNWPLYLDLSLLKNGFSTQRLSYSLGKILLLDSTQKTLILVDLSKKTNQVLAGPEQLGGAQEASLNGDFGFVYSLDKGVVKLDTKATKATQAIQTDSDWGRIVDSVGFGGNIYLLDSIKNQIWKYTPAASGYSDKQAYLKKDVKADFSSGKRMLIDSSIWILKSGSGIEKYTQGIPDSFNIGGLDKPIKDISAFFVSDETDDIYLLDSGNSRVVVLKKNGQYVSQMVGDKFKTASDLIVDEQGKKLYLLERNKIYQVDLH